MFLSYTAYLPPKGTKVQGFINYTQAKRLNIGTPDKVELAAREPAPPDATPRDVMTCRRRPNQCTFRRRNQRPSDHPRPKKSRSRSCALKEFKERKLWNPKYTSFEDYCYQRWDFGARRANQMIRAAHTAEILGPPFPANEGITREFAKVIEQDPETGQAAWAAFTAENPNPTAKETRAFLRYYLSEPDATRPAPQRPLAADAIKKSFKYIESTLSELDPKQRQAYLVALQRYAQEAYYISMGAYRPRKGQKIGGFINWDEATETWYRTSDRDA